MPGSFFDSNILLYFLSDDEAKADRAEAVVYQGGTVSVQVLNEVASVARRKQAMSWLETHRFLDLLRGVLSVVPVTLDIHDRGLSIAERYKIALFDAMIVAAAVIHRCDTLWSEDMHHGLMVDDTLRIVNPFRVDP